MLPGLWKLQAGVVGPTLVTTNDSLMRWRENHWPQRGHWPKARDTKPGLNPCPNCSSTRNGIVTASLEHSGQHQWGHLSVGSVPPLPLGSTGTQHDTNPCLFLRLTGRRCPGLKITFFFSFSFVSSSLALCFFLSKPSVLTTPPRALLVAKWDAARFMNCLIKPIRSSSWPGWILFCNSLNVLLLRSCLKRRPSLIFFTQTSSLSWASIMDSWLWDGVCLHSSAACSLWWADVSRLVPPVCLFACFQPGTFP